MIEIRFRDIDPDTGGVSQDQKLAVSDSQNHANWIKYSLEQHGKDDPNREFYLVDLENPNRELTYEERIRWFFSNYYETGMEYLSLLHTMKSIDLDRVNWIDGEVIRIPRTLGEVKHRLD